MYALTRKIPLSDTQTQYLANFILLREIKKNVEALRLRQDYLCIYSTTSNLTAENITTEQPGFSTRL